jgi:type IV pilus assembly protein PilO
VKEQLEIILKLPLPKRIAILVGFLALTGFFLYYFSLSSSWMKIEELKSEVDDLQLEVAKKKGIVAKLPVFRKEVKRLDQELAKALEELPDKKGIEKLLTQISNKARNAGLDIELFQPAPERKKDFYAEIPVQLKVLGTYHQLASFFNEVGDLDRIVNLTGYQFVLNELTKKEIRLSADVMATSFRFLDQKERITDEGKGKKRRRKRKK